MPPALGRLRCATAAGNIRWWLRPSITTRQPPRLGYDPATIHQDLRMHPSRSYRPLNFFLVAFVAPTVRAFAELWRSGGTLAGPTGHGIRRDELDANAPAQERALFAAREAAFGADHRPTERNEDPSNDSTKFEVPRYTGRQFQRKSDVFVLPDLPIRNAVPVLCRRQDRRKQR